MSVWKMSIPYSSRQRNISSLKLSIIGEMVKFIPRSPRIRPQFLRKQLHFQRISLAIIKFDENNNVITNYQIGQLPKRPISKSIG